MQGRITDKRRLAPVLPDMALRHLYQLGIGLLFCCPTAKYRDAANAINSGAGAPQSLLLLLGMGVICVLTYTNLFQTPSLWLLLFIPS